ncbi:hypothetical protein Hdeb2414_s0016g00469301 [Helianthus debilis subsp. tardiflorus]
MFFNTTVERSYNLICEGFLKLIRVVLRAKEESSTCNRKYTPKTRCLFEESSTVDGEENISNRYLLLPLIFAR